MKIFTIVGPTGVGKTAIAIELAKQYDLEIISADSRQIYKYMDIGTAKPQLADGRWLKANGDSIKFHMVDIVTPDVLYSAADFARDVSKVIAELTTQNKRFILVGGSGLYLKALFEPFFSAPPRDLKLRKVLSREPLDELYERLKIVDPESAQRIHCQDRQRIIRALEIYEQTRKPLSVQLKTETKKSQYEPYYVGITMPRKLLYDKINRRFDVMMENGLVDEVKNLLQMGYTKEHNALNGIGYQEIIRFLDGEISLTQAINIAKTRSRQYAKRQITWFKKVKDIRWIEFTEFEPTFNKVKNEYEKYLKEISHKD
ncbi:MAG: tRNA (adenosine(37)-N6)-dimethylallyltransferase MiaA [candidate division WOR-3 bacterium]|nr:tRNA (adenosine(37)-N6)-dimethylallyltransferase MiaA [candidate division WOR-3 bacterium]